MTRTPTKKALAARDARHRRLKARIARQVALGIRAR